MFFNCGDDSWVWPWIYGNLAAIFVLTFVLAAPRWHQRCDRSPLSNLPSRKRLLDPFQSGFGFLANVVPFIIVDEVLQVRRAALGGSAGGAVDSCMAATQFHVGCGTRAS